MNTVTELLQPVENDLDDLILELKNLIGAGHPIPVSYTHLTLPTTPYV